MWRSRSPQRRPLLDLRNWIDRAQTPGWVAERPRGSIGETGDIDRRVGSTLESLPREDGGYQDAKAEAEAIRFVNEQLERSPRYIELTRAKRWNGVLPATMMGTNVTPLLSLK